MGKKIIYSFVILVLLVVGLIASPIKVEAKTSYKSSVTSFKSSYKPSKSSYKLPKSTYTQTTRTKRVNGYLKSNGTYVQPYYKTAPNKTKIDNYSTKGNTNPFTGKKGYKK